MADRAPKELLSHCSKSDKQREERDEEQSDSHEPNTSIFKRNQAD